MAMSSRFSQSNEGIFAPQRAEEDFTTECAEITEIRLGWDSFVSVLFFFDVIFIPLGNFNDDIGGAVGNGLATETRLRRDARRFVEFIEFGVRGFVAGVEALLNDDVARRACADAAAGVIESGFDALGNIENAAGQAVVAVRDL